MNPPVYVNSPCISLCVMDADTGYCLGCFRTKEEIAYWARLPVDERAEIIHQLERRRQSSED